MTTFIIIIALVLSISSASVAFAQSGATQKIFDDVQENVQTLITAKDKENKNGEEEFSLRLTTFKKVLDLSLAEANDLKVKLLTFEAKDERTDAWRDTQVERLTDLLVAIESSKKVLSNSGEEKLGLPEIQKQAQDFKEWREETYVPVLHEINSFFLIVKQKSSIDTAKERWEKINKDVSKLRSTKLQGIVAQLKEFLKKSGTSIAQAENVYEEAYKTFWKMYEIKQLPEIQGEESTSSVSVPVTSSQAFAPQILGTSGESTSTVATSTLSDEKDLSKPKPLDTSINDLVKQSLMKIKDTYQIFIEMSTVVRNIAR